MQIGLGRKAQAEAEAYRRRSTLDDEDGAKERYLRQISVRGEEREEEEELLATWGEEELSAARGLAGEGDREQRMTRCARPWSPPPPAPPPATEIASTCPRHRRPHPTTAITTLPVRPAPPSRARYGRLHSFEDRRQKAANDIQRHVRGRSTRRKLDAMAPRPARGRPAAPHASRPSRRDAPSRHGPHPRNDHLCAPRRGPPPRCSRFWHAGTGFRARDEREPQQAQEHGDQRQPRS